MLSPIHALFASPLLFPKKTGPAHNAAARAVANVYGPGYKGDPNATSSSAAAATHTPFQDTPGLTPYKLLHITCHTIPSYAPPAGHALCPGALANALRWASLVLAALVWVLFFPPDLKARTALAALSYSFSESAFTFFERGAAYTSGAQFAGNLLYVPVLLDGCVCVRCARGAKRGRGRIHCCGGGRAERVRGGAQPDETHQVERVCMCVCV